MGNRPIGSELANEQRSVVSGSQRSWEIDPHRERISKRTAERRKWLPTKLGNRPIGSELANEQRSVVSGSQRSWEIDP
ncbi:hypothetical protein C4X99_17095 [Leptospira interrogans serovar Geyaweera]|nr:hypothetical protein C4X99_17095 [Leptospira interrogans serovar Geyaweera]